MPWEFGKVCKAGWPRQSSELEVGYEGGAGTGRQSGGTKIPPGNEQGSRWSGEGLEGRVQGRRSQSGENAFIQHAQLSGHKVPSTEEGR